jgi:hypothetical protein
VRRGERVSIDQARAIVRDNRQARTPRPKSIVEIVAEAELPAAPEAGDQSDDAPLTEASPAPCCVSPQIDPDAEFRTIMAAWTAAGREARVRAWNALSVEMEETKPEGDGEDLSEHGAPRPTITDIADGAQGNRAVDSDDRLTVLESGLTEPPPVVAPGHMQNLPVDPFEIPKFLRREKQTLSENSSALSTE